MNTPSLLKFVDQVKEAQEASERLDSQRGGLRREREVRSRAVFPYANVDLSAVASPAEKRLETLTAVQREGVETLAAIQEGARESSATAKSAFRVAVVVGVVTAVSVILTAISTFGPNRDLDHLGREVSDFKGQLAAMRDEQNAQRQELIDALTAADQVAADPVGGALSKGASKTNEASDPP
ncbi:hypothetical protein [Thioclava sediminum]|nr:hypothetical protein [Thioclava sediminum]